MHINELPDKCPRCGHPIFKQTISIEGFAKKQYHMSINSTFIDEPTSITENVLSDNDYYNSVFCNACGTDIVEAGATKSSKKG